MGTEKWPRVGVGAVIKNEQDRILLVLRKKPPEAGHWSLPGGKVDYMETIENAVIREIREELGINIQIERLICVTNHIIESEDVHYVAPTFLANIVSGNVQNQEPHALEEVHWFAIDHLPANITITTDNALKHFIQQEGEKDI